MSEDSELLVLFNGRIMRLCILLLNKKKNVFKLKF